MMAKARNYSGIAEILIREGDNRAAPNSFASLHGSSQAPRRLTISA